MTKTLTEIIRNINRIIDIIIYIYINFGASFKNILQYSIIVAIIVNI